MVFPIGLSHGNQNRNQSLDSPSQKFLDPPLIYHILLYNIYLTHVCQGSLRGYLGFGVT